MPPVWQAWALATLSVFQFALAFWWWKGPRLQGTKGAVTALFVFTGIVTLSEAISGQVAAATPLVDIVGKTADRAANLSLLALALTAGGWRSKGLARPCFWALATVWLLTVPFWTGPMLGIGEPRTWAEFLVNLPLWLAVFATAGAIVKLVTDEGREDRQVWILTLSVIGFRFAELAAWISPGVGNVGEATEAALLAKRTLQALSLPIMLVAFIWLLLQRWRESSLGGSAIDLSVLLLLAGFFFGFARRTSVGAPPFAVLFSLALVRPSGFLGVQWLLHDTPIRKTTQWRQLRLGGVLVTAFLLGLPLGWLFQMTAVGSALVGLTLAALGGGLTRSLEDRPKDGPNADWSVDPRELPLDHNNVTLPEGWEERVRRQAQSFETLPEATRENLSALPRWQRIVLVLHSLSDDGELPCYERTTPGLHFLTHCPYPSIGSEISRTNARVEEILEDLGLPSPDHVYSLDEPIVASRMGRAEGLDSPRVKSYHLTPLGERIAERLVSKHGLEGLDRSMFAEILGEGVACTN